MRVWQRALLVLALIPILGIGLPFGGAFLYGRIAFAGAKSRAEACLTWCRAEMEALADAGHADAEALRALGFERMEEEDGAWLFRFPYDSGRWFKWVPCGLLISDNTEELPTWRKTEALWDGWYFFWEP